MRFKTLIVAVSLYASGAAFAGPAHAAATFQFSVTNSSQCSPQCGLDGPDGYARLFSAVDGANTIKVRASAWSIHTDLLRTAFLGHYSGGLGVTSSSSGPSGDGSGGSGYHTVDNKGSTDFILFQFDQMVVPDRALLNLYRLGSNTYTDADARVYITNAIATDWDDPYSAATLASQLSAMNTAMQYENLGAAGGATSPITHDFNNSGQAGNLFIFAARPPGAPDSKYDGFKLATLKVFSAVPEPDTWAFMIVGFGAVGYSLRSSRKHKLAPATA
jgi:hypothetical protein